MTCDNIVNRASTKRCRRIILFFKVSVGDTLNGVKASDHQGFVEGILICSRIALTLPALKDRLYPLHAT